MEKRTRRIGIKKYLCDKNIYVSYFTWSSTVAPTLMQCKNCNELFIYDDDSILYDKPLMEEIKNKKCPTCNKDLNDTLTKYHFNKSILNCNNLEIKTELDGLLDIYEIYS